MAAEYPKIVKNRKLNRTLTNPMISKMKCVIFAGGTDYGTSPAISPDDLVIAADSGYNACRARGITPHLAVGDWDSLEDTDMECQRVNLPVDKDDTDTLAAIRIGIERGFREFHIICGTGGRIDHTIANMQSLVFLAKQCKRGFLYDEGSVVTAVTDGEMLFPVGAKGGVGVFAADGNAQGVTIKGLKYTLDNAVLTADFPVGVSNSFVGKESVIAVKKGTLYVVFPTGVFPL